MRRRDPFPLADAISDLVRAAQPNTPLAAIQRVWPDGVGETIAGGAVPAAEHDGLLTVHCTDSVTAHQLNSMQLEIVEKLRTAAPNVKLREIRFRVGAVE